MTNRCTMLHWVGIFLTIGLLGPGILGCWGGAFFAVTEINESDDKQSLAITPPSAFSLVSPSDGTTEILSPIPKLTWSDAVGETNYVVEIDDSPVFQVPLTFQSFPLSFNSSSLIVPDGVLTSGTQYHWRIAARNAGGLTLASPGPFSFTPYDGPWAKLYSIVPTLGFTHFGIRVEPTSDGGVICVDQISCAVPSGPGYDIACYKVNDDSTIDWQFAFGGADYDTIQDVAVGLDDAVFLVGFTQSFGLGGVYVFKLSSQGELLWQKALTGGLSASCHALSNGGVVVRGNISGENRLLVFSSDGTLLWENSYTGGAIGTDILETSDGGLLSFGGGTSLVKFANNGAFEWANTYSGGGVETFGQVIQTVDDGFLVCGQKDDDGWVLKLESNGTLVWQFTYDNAGNSDILIGAHQAANGDFLVGGTTGIGVDPLPWVLRLQSDGVPIWQLAYDDGFYALIGGGSVTAILENSRGHIRIHATGIYPDTFVIPPIIYNKQGLLLMNVDADGVLPSISTATGAIPTATLATATPYSLTPAPSSTMATPIGFDPSTDVTVTQISP